MSVRRFPQRRSAPGFGRAELGSPLFGSRPSVAALTPLPSAPASTPVADASRNRDVTNLESRLAQLELALSALQDKAAVSPRPTIAAPATRKGASAAVSNVSPFTVFGNAPEYRVEEIDQTDPAGRYRWGSTGDNFMIARSQGTGWANALGGASDYNFVEYNRTNAYVSLTAPESNSWYSQLLAGAAATPGTNALVKAQANATLPKVILSTGNAGGGSNVARLTVNGGSSTPDVDITSANLNLNANNLKQIGVLDHDGGTAGFFGATPTTQQSGGANLTNNVASGGSNDTIANFTDLATYANDAAAIRNDIYQLARTLKQDHDALRAYGLLT